MHKFEKHNCKHEIEKDEIKKHKVHIPRHCFSTEHRYQSKNGFRRRERLEVFTVLQFDSAIDMQQGQPHFDLMVGTDKSTGAVWASAVLPLIKKASRKDPYISHRSSHGCQNWDIQSSSYSQMLKLSCALYNQGAQRRKTHRVKLSNDNHSNTAIRTKKLKSIFRSRGYKLYALIWCTKFRVRRIQESPSRMTVLYLLGYRGMQHGHTCDSANSKIRQYMRRSVTFYLSEKQLHAGYQEHGSASWNQYGWKVFGSDVTARRMNI